MIPSISREELYRSIVAGRPPLLLEALPERYYAQKHLPGARLFPHDQVDILAPTLPDREADIVVYCASATCQNSHITARRLAQLGYTQVRVYAGGKQDWEEAGLPFESGVLTAAAA